ncbi:hypothetical protein M5K25_021385 [Dendrobium thyrsiflorum]|uniref:Uncharacterized protein n=1 Tax=Dendrobium thyrsiflorum TaxID=117978 RepID=A0ABD0UCA0_DENTH
MERDQAGDLLYVGNHKPQFRSEGHGSQFPRRGGKVFWLTLLLVWGFDSERQVLKLTCKPAQDW